LYLRRTTESFEQPNAPVISAEAAEETPAPKWRTFMESKPILVSVADAAQMLSIGRTAAWDLVRKQKIRSVKIGRTRRVPIAAIQDFIQRLMDENAA
jgi:excisionase family DNA binding protein